MTTVVGRCGGDVRGDAEVSVESSGTALVEVRSLVGELYGEAIRDQVARVLAAFGSPAVAVRVRDAGALPFVLEARLEAALAAHRGVPLPPIEPRVPVISTRRLRRTRLYVPGDSPKLIPNAMLYGADVVVLDLEDSVAPEAKAAARAMVRRALAGLDWRRIEVAVRINAGPMGLEDARCVAPGADLLLVPKAEDPETIQEIAALLDELEAPTLLLPIVESARGVLRVFDVASASPRIAAVALGLEDLTADLGVQRTQEGAETAWAQGALIVGCRAAGVAPLNSVYSVADDPEGVERYARRAGAMGFEGIGCIHPRQVAPAHRGFAPDSAEIDRARRLVAGYERALGEGRGVVAFEGGMVDVPVYERARRTLARAAEAR